MSSSTKGLIMLLIGVLGAAAIVKIIDDITKEKKYVCPNCDHVLRKGIAKCPSCGISLRWAK